jgi:formate dehydrogenase major subunit
MALAKIEINGKRVIADTNQTILEVARLNGINDIPTLCHDDQLEPFSSCFVCVVKVQGARTLVPACSTKVFNGMVVETINDEIRRARKAALELILSNHYADCIGPCQVACPAQVDIQGYIALAAIGKYEDAINLIKESNPLPSICGRICTRPCEVKGCRRSMLDEAVGIDYIKRYVADIQLGKAITAKPADIKPNGKRIAVIGAGPAGLSCAYYLALKGYDIDIFEAQPEAGGMLRYGIPEYRLPKDILDLEVNQILELGVKLYTNMTLGKDFTVAGLKDQGYASVYLGLGAWDSSKMRVKGEDAEGVLSGIDFLKNFGLRKKINIYGKVAVVGGGNTAIDCARTALRLGVGELKLLYRRTRNEMPANEMEIHEAEQEGVDMEFLVAPVRVIANDKGRLTGLECVRMELGEPDASGRRSPKPIKNSEFIFECDFVISAIGQSTKVNELVDGHIPNFLPFGETLNLTRWQTIVVNEKTFETSVEGVFSGGDVVTGAATAIEAIAAGRKAAYAMDQYIVKGKAKPEPVEYFSRKDTYHKVDRDDLKSLVAIPKRLMPVLTPEERIKSFVEVEQGYTLEDVKRETTRCLECGCVALFTCDLRQQATEYGVTGHFSGEAKEYKLDVSHPLIELDPNKCIMCGRCVRICGEVVGVSAYGFINRGFNTIVKPAMGGSLLDTDCVSCGLCIGTCPTGAISQKIPLEKPGPWNTETVPTICHYCGVGCNLNYDVYGDTVVKVSRNQHNKITFGNHCKKGRFGYEYIHSKERMLQPQIRAGRELQNAGMDEAIQFAATRLKELTKKYSSHEMAVFVSPRLTNEEIYLAQKFARIALRTHNVTSFAGLVNQEVFYPELVSTASYHDVVDAQVLLVVNSNLDTEHFVVDVMSKRALRNGGKMIYINDKPNRASQFAEYFLQCKDASQPYVVLGILKEYAAIKKTDFSETPELQKAIDQLTTQQITEKTGVSYTDIQAAAQILAKSILKVMIHNKDFRGLRTIDDSRQMVHAAEQMDCSILSMNEKANMQGLLDMGANPAWYPGYLPTGDPEAIDELEKMWCVVLRDLDTQNTNVAQLLREKKIKVAIMIGEDPLGNESIPMDLRNGLFAADFLVTADLYFTDTAKASNVVLPLSAIAETSGTMTNSERRVQPIIKAIPSPIGFETWQILSQLASGMGYRFKMNYYSPAEVMDEIRKVVPIYKQVDVTGRNGEAIWDLNEFKLAKIKMSLSPNGKTASTIPTLYLDRLEKHFEEWFEEKFKHARANRQV